MPIHDVIYVPGLGDHNARGQESLIATWSWWGVRPHMFRMHWNNGSFKPKLQTLLAKIDELHDAGHTVSLVGASAGATAALNAFAARPNKIHRVVLIAGWVHHPENIGPVYRSKNPAFVESAMQVKDSLDILQGDVSRIQSRYAIIDLIVPSSNSLVGGASNRVVFSFGHGLTIATQLLFGAPFWIRFLKRPL
jgi:pimeloyl-ACP methyl ester carboxylesterase